MSSLDDIFVVSDTEEEDEDNDSFGKDTETSSPIIIKPTPQIIEIPKESEESSIQNKLSEEENQKIEKKPQPDEIKEQKVENKKNENKQEENSKKESIKQEKEKRKETKEEKNKIQKPKEISENSPSYPYSEISESSEKRYSKKPRNKHYIKRNNDFSDFDLSDINPQTDFSDKIDKLRRLIEENKQQFETDFEDLKSKHSEKLAILKQNNISREQSLSSSFDLEYRNVIWTTTLHHLKRGCFSENLGLLFQQAVNDEQFQLEKELIEAKQKNEEEIAYYKSKMPAERARRRIRKRRSNINILSPRAMATMINNRFLSAIDTDDFDYDIANKIDALINKIQKESQYLTLNTLEPFPLPKQLNNFNIQTPIPKAKKIPRRSKSPRMIQNEKHLEMLKKHQKACNNLQKSVKKTDRYIKEMQGNDWFQEMFPHVE